MRRENNNINLAKLFQKNPLTNQALVNMEELDLMESAAKEIDPDDDDDVEVFRMKKQHFQAATKYLVRLNLAKYSVEKGDEFEITLNKNTQDSIISQIKEFTSQEIPVSNYERSLSAMNELSENYLNVHFIISRSTVLLYGLKREVSSAKLDLLAQLGNPDENNMGMTDCKETNFEGKAASDQNSQEIESNVKQTQSYTPNDKLVNSDDGRVGTSIESISVENTSVESSSVESTSVESSSVESTSVESSSIESTSVESTSLEGTSVKSISVESTSIESSSVESTSIESAPILRCEKETCNTSPPGHSHVLKHRRAQFYVGPKTNLKIYVRKENITKLDVDIIVTASNQQLRHAGGVAKAVAVAAGQSLVNECNSHITAHGPLDITDVFVSTGGRLRATYVIHAAGPKWEAYEDKRKCLTDLRRTVIRCLVEASRLQKVSIALPSISAALLKVPEELCAQCYVEAVKSFDDFADKLGVVSVKDVRFVDVDDVMVNIIEEKFTSEWPKPVDGKIAKGDFEFALQHLSKKGDDIFGRSVIKDKDQRQSYKGMRLLDDESTGKLHQEDVSTTISYQVNSIQISIVTKPATVYRSTIVVVGELFDELSGLHEFNVKDLAKPIHDLPIQKGEFQYLSLSKPDGSRSTLICQLHPNPDSPGNVTKAFGNLDNAKEIHKSNSVVFTSAIFYAKSTKTRDHSKIISRITQMVFNFAAGTSRNNSVITSILIATGADCIPHVIKILDSRNAEKIFPGNALKEAGNEGASCGYPAKSGDFPPPIGSFSARSRDFPPPMGSLSTRSSFFPAAKGSFTAMSRDFPPPMGIFSARSRFFPAAKRNFSARSRNFRVKAGGFPDTLSGYLATPRVVKDLGSPVNSQDRCSVCFESINIESLKCCQALLCSTCLGKVSICPLCRCPFAILTGMQPKGEMNCFYSSQDVEGYERKGSLEICYIIPAGIQTKELQHPSPGKPYKSIKRTAYLPATDDGYRALRLLRVAFHRRLIFTIDVSHTTRMEGIVWNIHHKTSRNSSTHGYPDPTYVTSLMDELRQYGVTDDSVTVDEKRLVEKFMESLSRKKKQFAEFD
ncbi:unnamed protein product [Lymnaea stagnalis]|uniref:RING-type E3 ubiquitin transferase n=1 Tax=Lymnaea stagnalis TaxID=6523 RepID=A0AAV2H162_LYMST